MLFSVSKIFPCYRDKKRKLILPRYKSSEVIKHRKDKENVQMWKVHK